MEIRIDARKVAVALLVVAIALICLHVAGMFARYVLGHERLLGVIDTFNVNYENNVPTFFSAFLLVSCAALLAVIARQPPARPGDSRYWGWLSLIFVLLAMDEDASIHELWTGPLQYLLDADGALYFAWVIPYGIGLVVVGLLYLRFVLRLPEPTRRLAILSGGLYVAGAFGLELVGGWYVSRFDGNVDFPYSIIVAGEEFLEMSGTILFIHTLLDYLRRLLGDEPLRIRIQSG